MDSRPADGFYSLDALKQRGMRIIQESVEGVGR